LADKPAPSLLKSGFIVASFTLLSRVLGLARDIVFARFIGAGDGADAFFIAFKIPNFMRRLFAEGAFAQAFVPVLSEYREQGSHAAVKALIDRVAGSLGLVLTLVTAVAVLASPVMATLFAPGFTGDAAKFQLTSDLIRITFPYLMLISLTGFAGSILNSYDRFAVPALTPVLLNVSLISAAVLASDGMVEPVVGLAYGVLAAGVVQLVFQLPFLASLHLLPSPKLDWQDSGVRKILGLMVPALFGVSVSQINLLLDTVLASLLPGNSVSWLYYSDRLAELPLGVFAIAISTVILPKLSRQHTGSHERKFSDTLDWALRLIVFIGLPASLALIVLAEPILATLFLYGKTTALDISMSSLSLQAYASGLLAFMLIKVLAPGYYARQDMKTPVKIGVIAMVSNMVLNLLFVIPLHFYFQVGHVGLALATAVSAYLNAFLLYRGLRRERVYTPKAAWTKSVLRCVSANVAMLAVLLFALNGSQDWIHALWFERVTHLAVICVAGLSVYVAALWIGGVRLRDFKAS